MGKLSILLALPIFFTFSAYAKDSSQFSVEAMTNACEAALDQSVLEEAQKRWSGKTVVLDTNVLLNDPFAIFKYPGARVVLPSIVIGELNNKKEDFRLGKAARTAGHLLDDLIRQNGVMSKDGLPLPMGAKLVIATKDYTHLLDADDFESGSPDNKIVATAVAETSKEPHGTVFLISDDVNMRVKAAIEEVVALPFEYEWSHAPKAERSFEVLKVSEESLRQFLATGELALPEDAKVVPNEFVQLETENYPGSLESLARYHYDRENPAKSGLRKLAVFPRLPFEPKNIEQAMALDLLMDPTIDLVIMDSPAGTGKTFVSLMAGLAQIGSTGQYEKMMITRTLVQIGKTPLGTVPGDANQKMAEWYQSFFDNFKALKTAGKEPPSKTQLKKNARQANQSQNPGKGNKIPGVELVAFPHIRGRSIAQSYIVMDEAQNSSVHEMKTFLTRAGEGSKIVILGDPSQIDLPFLNERNNGLSVATALFTADTLSPEDRSRVGFIKLTEGVRSALAELARKLFEQPVPQ